MDVCLIQTEKLKELAKQAFLYDYLNCGGVDNWIGYSEAINNGISLDAQDLNINIDNPEIDDIVEAWLEKEYPTFNLEKEITKCTKEYLQQY